MRLHRAILVAATSLVFLSVTASADAPPDQYDTFLKTTERIRDRYTVLRWDRFDIVARSTTTLDDDEKFCQTRTTQLGGPGRLPTVKELLTLVDETPHDEVTGGTTVEARAIDRNAFPGTPVALPYVSTAGAGEFWVVDFTTGTVSVVGQLPQPHYVRCVLAE